VALAHGIRLGPVGVEKYDAGMSIEIVRTGSSIFSGFWGSVVSGGNLDIISIRTFETIS